MQSAEALNYPVNHELLRIGYAPSYPNRSVGAEELSPTEYARYLAPSGKMGHATIADLVTSPSWQTLDDEAKIDAAAKAMWDARRSVRETLFGAAPRRLPGSLAPPGGYRRLPRGFVVDELPEGFELDPAM